MSDEPTLRMTIRREGPDGAANTTYCMMRYIEGGDARDKQGMWSIVGDYDVPNSLVGDVQSLVDSSRGVRLEVFKKNLNALLGKE